MLIDLYGCIVLDSDSPYVDEEYNDDISGVECSYVFKTSTHIIKVDKYQLDMYLKYHVKIVECSGSTGDPVGHVCPEHRCNNKSVEGWCKKCYGIPQVISLTHFYLDLPPDYINKIESIEDHPLLTSK